MFAEHAPINRFTRSAMSRGGRPAHSSPMVSSNANITFMF